MRWLGSKRSYRIKQKVLSTKSLALIRVSLALVIVFGAAAPFLANYLKPSLSHAITPYNASDVLGQTDINGDPLFTTSERNNLNPNALGLSAPAHQAVDNVNHRIFVADSNNNRVLVYNTDVDTVTDNMAASNVIGQPDFISRGSTTVNASSLSGPTGVSYDASADRLFVADQNNNRVLVYDLSSGITNGMAATNVLGQANFSDHDSNRGGSAAANTISFVDGISYDPGTQNLYLSDLINNRVLVYDISGGITDGMAATHVLGQPDFSTTSCGSGSATKLCNPSGLELDAASNLLFVADTAFSRVVIYNIATIVDGEAAVNVLGQANFTSIDCDRGGTTAANTLCLPGGVSFDSTNDLLFIADLSNHRVLVYDISGGITDGMAATHVLGQSDFTSNMSNQGGAVSATSLGDDFGLTYYNNRLVVADRSNNRVLFFDTTTIVDGEAAVNVLGQPGFTTDYTNSRPRVNDSGMVGPESTAIDTINHQLFVVDTSQHANRRILVYNLDSSNNLIDRTADFVLGQTDFNTTSAGLSSQKFNDRLGAIVVDSTSHTLFVADSNSNRILVFDTTSITNGEAAVHVLGQSDFVSSGSATSDTGMSFPEGLGYDSTNHRLFVVDNHNNRVLVFDTSTIVDGEAAVNVLGQSDFVSSGSATSDTGMNTPSAAEYDGINNRLFVADSINNRVLVFDTATITDGEAAVNVLGQLTFLTATPATTAIGMAVPVALAYDINHSRLFVKDSDNNRVLIYDLSAGIIDGQAASGLLGQVDFTSSDVPASPLQNNFDVTGERAGSWAYDVGNDRLWLADGNFNRVLAFDFAHITTSTLPAGVVGTAYNQTINSAGSQGTTTMTLSSGTLPPGLSFDGSAGTSATISGTPTTAGTYNFEVTVSDANGNAGTFTDTVAYSIVVTGGSTPAPPPTPTPTSTPTPAPGTGGTGRGTGGLGAGGVVTVPTPTTIDLNTFSDFVNGTGQNLTGLPVGTVLTFTVTLADGTTRTYTVTITGIDSSNPADPTVTITIDGPGYHNVFVLHNNQPITIDVTGDGTPDVTIEASNITATTVDMKFTLLKQPGLTATTSETKTTTPPAKKHRNIWPWIIGGAAILALGGGIWAAGRRRRHQ